MDKQKHVATQNKRTYYSIGSLKSKNHYLGNYTLYTLKNNLPMSKLLTINWYGVFVEYLFLIGEPFIWQTSLTYVKDNIYIYI